MTEESREQPKRRGSRGHQQRELSEAEKEHIRRLGELPVGGRRKTQPAPPRVNIGGRRR